MVDQLLGGSEQKPQPTQRKNQEGGVVEFFFVSFRESVAAFRSKRVEGSCESARVKVEPSLRTCSGASGRAISEYMRGCWDLGDT